MKRLLYLLHFTLMSCFAFAPVPASAVEVIVAGNASPRYGLEREAVITPLNGLAAKLFRYKDVILVDAINVPAETFEQRVGAAGRAAKRTGQDFVILYFYGLGAHDQTGKSYLVPYEWTGKQSELIGLAGVIGGMREAAGKKSLIVLDIVDTDPALWPGGSLRPGLGRIDREAGDGSVQIVYNHGVADGKNRTQFMASFEEQLSKPVELMQLASLVQADVRFKSGGASVPRLVGTASVPVSLSQLSDEEAGRKSSACHAENDRLAQFANAGGEGTATDAQGAVLLLAANGTVHREDDLFPLLCPFARLFKKQHLVSQPPHRYGHAHGRKSAGERRGASERRSASAGPGVIYVPN